MRKHNELPHLDPNQDVPDHDPYSFEPNRLSPFHEQNFGKITEGMSRRILKRSDSEQCSDDLYAQLFMLPILVRASKANLESPEVWREAQEPVRDAIASWFPADGSRTVVFSSICWLEWPAAWPPDVVRKYLARALRVSDGVQVKFSAVTFPLPASAPRLSFVIVARVRPQHWPVACVAPPMIDMRHQSVVAHALHMAQMNPRSVSDYLPAVMRPMPWRDAVVSGVSKWLAEIHRRTGIKGWILEPEKGGQVAVRLLLNDENVPRTGFSLGLHHTGTRGLNQILSELGRLAPCAEQPAS